MTILIGLYLEHTLCTNYTRLLIDLQMSCMFGCMCVLVFVPFFLSEKEGFKNKVMEIDNEQEPII